MTFNSNQIVGLTRRKHEKADGILGRINDTLQKRSDDESFFVNPTSMVHWIKPILLFKSLHY